MGRYLKKMTEWIAAAAFLAAAFYVGRQAAVLVNSISTEQSQMQTDSNEIKKKFCVVIDAGHGGEDPGKVGVNGTRYEIADYLDKGEEVSFFWLNSLDKTYSDSVLFTTTNNRIFTLNNMFDEPNVIGEVDNEYFILGFSGFDTDTGYGIVCYDSAREKTYMVSAFSDTELTFPNNTYFTMIAYNLAILFCNKQGKDNTALRIELERQENVFYDSLHRDETSFRITNVDSFN